MRHQLSPVAYKGTIKPPERAFLIGANRCRDSMDDKQILQNANRSATQAGMIALAFLDFAAKLIKHVRRGYPLDDASLATLRDSCIRDLKNSTMIGMSLEEEAETFRQAIENAEKLLDGAIARGRQP
jgi:hypothetical protein